MLVAGSVVAAAPESLWERLRAVAEPRALVTPERLRAAVPEHIQLVGPARIAYLHRPLTAPAGLERIDSPSDPRLQPLRARVTAEEWEHANLAAAEVPIFAALVAGELAAAAGFERLDGRVAHLGVLADPRRRGRGLARRASHASAAHAQAMGLLPQWQTLAANTPALDIAESLGFEPFAVTLSARLE